MSHSKNTLTKTIIINIIFDYILATIQGHLSVCYHCCMSGQIEKLTSRIEQAATNYAPGQDVLHALSAVTLVAVIGPSAVGKTTVMNSVVSIDADFARVNSFTTRPRRPNESSDTYRFLDQNESTLTDILAQIQRRELVQIAVHPTTRHVYGSLASDYSHTYMMLDALPNSIAALQSLPFKTLKKVALTTEASLWNERFLTRESTISSDQARKRIEEGIANIAWSLEQGDQIWWLENNNQPAHEAAAQLIEIAKRGGTPEEHGRQTGAALLSYMKRISQTI